MTEPRFAHDLNVPIALPCGRLVTIDPLDGFSQKRLAPNREGRIADPNAAITDVLARCVKTVDGKRFDPKRMHDEARRMPGGSRLKAFMIARMLTYGSECVVESKCPSCDAPQKNARHVDEVEALPYAVEFLASGFTFSVLSLAGVRREFRVVVDTGTTATAFAAALTKDEVGVLDSPLAQVVEVDGRPAALAGLMALSGDVLDDVRKVVRLMEPRAFLTPERQAAWVAKANAFGRALGRDIPEPDDDGDAPPLWVPQGGMKTRFEACCDKCGHTSWLSLEQSPDFFFRHIQRVLED